MIPAVRRPDPIPIVFLAALVLLALVPFLGFLPRDVDVSVSGEDPDGIAGAYAEVHPGLRIAVDTPDERLALRPGAVPFTEVDATVAARWRQLGVEGSFTPLKASTIVVAYDPARVEVGDVDYLADVGRLGHALFLPDGDTGLRAITALSYAAGGPDLQPAGRDAAMALLRSARTGPGLTVGGSWREWEESFADVPVALLADDQAAALKSAGLPIEVLVPRDAALTWVDGIWSADPARPAPELPPEVLADHGFRAADGTADPDLYPPAPAYSRARVLDTAADRDLLDRTYEGAWGEVRRTVLRTHFHTPATGRERNAVYLVLAVAMLLWGATLTWRARSRMQGRLMQAIAFTMSAWILVRTLKDAAPLVGHRLLWYAFLPSMLVLVGLFALLAIDVAGPKRIPPLLRRVLKWGTALAALTVLTNDLHQLVYRLDLGTARTDLHGYGPAFHAIVAWIIGWSVFTIASLVRSAGRLRNHAPMIAAGATIAVLVAYHAAYVLRMPVVRQTETTLMTIICLIVLVESLIRSGLVPANRRYLELFQATTVPLSILDRDFTPIDSSSAATPLPETALAELAGGAAVARHRPGDGTAIDFHRIGVDGGHVVWETDMGPLTRARTRLAATRANLDRRLRVLRHAATADGDRRKLEYGNKVLQMLQDTIDDKLADVAIVGRRLAAGGDASIPELRHVGLALTYCKRAGLAILESADRPLDVPTLAGDLDKLCGSFTAGDDETGVIVRGSGELPTATYIAALSLVHRLLDDAAQLGPPSIAGLLTVRVGSGTVEATVLWEADGGIPEAEALLASTRSLPGAPGLAGSVALLRADVEADGPGVRLSVRLGVDG